MQSIAEPCSARDSRGAEPRRTRGRRVGDTLRALAGLALAAGLMAVAFAGVDLTEVGRRIAGLGPLAAVILVPSTFALLAETLAWSHVITGLGTRPPFCPLLGVRIATEALGTVLPMGAIWAEAVKPPLLAKRCGMPLATSLASIVARKYLLLSTQGMYVLIGFALGHVLLATAFTRAGASGQLAWLAVAVGLALVTLAELGALAFRRGDLFARALAFGERFPVRFLRERLVSLREQMPSADGDSSRFFATSLAGRAKPLGLCLVTWLFEATETWLVLTLLGASLGWGDAVAVEALVVLLRHVLVALPGGLGAQELGYATLLAAGGVGLEQATAFALVKRGKELVWVTVGLLLLSSWQGRRAAQPLPTLPPLPLVASPAAAPG